MQSASRRSKDIARSNADSDRCHSSTFFRMVTVVKKRVKESDVNLTMILVQQLASSTSPPRSANRIGLPPWPLRECVAIRIITQPRSSTSQLSSRMRVPEPAALAGFLVVAHPDPGYIPPTRFHPRARRGEPVTLHLCHQRKQI